MNRKGRHGRAAGRVTWAPSTSRPILARGVTTGANLLTPVIPLNGGASQDYARQWLAPVDLPSLPALRRPVFRSDPSKAVSVLYVEASHALSSRSVMLARMCRPLTPERPLGPGTPPPDPPSHTSAGGLPLRSAAQRMALSVRADGFGR